MYRIISNYLGIFILGIGEILFAKIVLNKDFEVKKIFVLITLLCITVCSTISFYFFDGVIKTLLVYIIHLFAYKYLFNLSYLKAMFLTFLYVIVLMFPVIFWLFIVTNINKLNDFIFSNNLVSNLVSNLAVCVLFVVTTYILKNPLRKVFNADISNNTKIVLLSIITLICIISFFHIFALEFSINGNALPYFISMCVLIIILLSLIKKTYENNKLMKEYDKLLEFMTTYETEIEKQRILRHETKNEFLAIKAKLCDKQKDKEIIDYIDEILKDKIIVNQEKYAKFGYLPPNGIKGLCYFKVQEAENLGIKVSINISSKIKKSSIYNLEVKNQRELGKLLGVFLDNAIEASSKSEKKQLGIEIYVTKNKDTTITISNTFNNDINKNKIGKERFTTKGKDRGHGLLLAKHIVSKNDIFKTKTEISNEIYIQILHIKTK